MVKGQRMKGTETLQRLTQIMSTTLQTGSESSLRRDCRSKGSTLGVNHWTVCFELGRYGSRAGTFLPNLCTSCQHPSSAYVRSKILSLRFGAVKSTDCSLTFRGGSSCIFFGQLSPSSGIYVF